MSIGITLSAVTHLTVAEEMGSVAVRVFAVTESVVKKL
jgi:hypothetical protein